MHPLENIRSCRTGVNVESNKDEAAVRMLVVFPDVLALHGAHIGTKGERTILGDTAGASTADHGVEDQTVEVTDLGRIVRAERYRRDSR